MLISGLKLQIMVLDLCKGVIENQHLYNILFNILSPACPPHLLIVSGCLRPALSPGTAAWSLSPAWTAGQDTWWSLLTGRCAYKSRPCKQTQVTTCFIWISSSRTTFSNCAYWVRRLKPEVNVCSLDGVEQQLGHSCSLHVDEVRLEQGLRGSEPLSTYVHLSAIRELHQTEKSLYSLSYWSSHFIFSTKSNKREIFFLIFPQTVFLGFSFFFFFFASTYSECLHQVGGLCGQTLLLFNVVSHIAELLLQHTHGLKVGRVVESVTTEQQELMVGR